MGSDGDDRSDNAEIPGGSADAAGPEDDGADRDVDAVLDALGNEHTRAVLAAAGDGPVDADDIAETCDASLPTVYRRLDDLCDLGLVDERRRVDDDGTHYQTYEATVDHLRVDVADGALGLDAR
ncbi:ArsR/SmtB family transcription factor [Halobaculum sp. D14]|uniref:ArsR/SmtB family transcription factor n=1 Tax=unclassified Halobaculum TaxID=2640896 RepID=UPI003EB9CA05